MRREGAREGVSYLLILLSTRSEGEIGTLFLEGSRTFRIADWMRPSRRMRWIFQKRRFFLQDVRVQLFAKRILCIDILMSVWPLVLKCWLRRYERDRPDVRKEVISRLIKGVVKGMRKVKGRFVYLSENNFKWNFLFKSEIVGFFFSVEPLLTKKKSFCGDFFFSWEEFSRKCFFIYCCWFFFP